MDFEAWTNRAIDHERRRRLVYGYVLGILTMGSLGTAMALTAKDAPTAEEAQEDVMALELAEEPEAEPEPEPEPVAAEPPPPQEMIQQPAGPVLPTLEVPTEVPDDAPAEKDTAADDFNPYASADPYQYATQGTVRNAPAGAKKVVVAAPAVAKPAGPAAPSRITADTTPPKMLPGTGAAAAYPAAAKAAGIEGRVVVSFVVDVTGSVSEVQAVQGPEALRSACEESVKTRRYSPAMRDGQPVSVKKNAVCNFKLN